MYLFQPTAGVLGTHKKAVVFEMIKEHKKFPNGYFWQIEIVSFYIFLRSQ